MEASGGFEKAVATCLHEAGYPVSVVNPRRIKGYAESQLQRTKTDPADAALIARFGDREDPRPWEPPAAAQSRLQELTRALCRVTTSQGPPFEEPLGCRR